MRALYFDHECIYTRNDDLAYAIDRSVDSIADGHDWQFTAKQEAKLQQYYDANLLLANCLNSECYVSREVLEAIEATMLLPVAEIDKWKEANRKS